MQFLGRKTARIDALIEKKRSQIDLLQEKRIALISHAITKGITLNVPMKESGIDWLGEVPGHWEIWKITHAFQQLGSGTTPKSDDLDYYGGGVPWVTTSELRETVITDTMNKLTLTALHQYSGLRLYPEGTLLFAMYGATIGRMGILETPSTVNPACAAFVGPRHLDAKFLFYWLQMRRPTLIALAVGGGQPNLSQDELRQLRVPAPSLGEQRAIVGFLDAATSKIDVLIAKVNLSIERLREYRTTLVSAAVAGKIDVRQEVTTASPRPARIASLPFRRAVAAAEIAHRLHDEPTFGRVKFQKILYLCECHIGMDFDGNYRRKAAGPLDNRLLHSIQSQLSKQAWYAAREDRGRTVYIPLEHAGGHELYFRRYWSTQRTAFDTLIELTRPMSTEQLEIVATLFAAWNDFLLDGCSPTDAEVVGEVRTNWHKSKERFDADRLHRALTWMRGKGLVPAGRGKKTVILEKDISREEMFP